MADNTQSESNNRSSGMSSDVTGAIEIPEQYRDDLVRSGHSAKSNRKGRKEEKEKEEKEKEEKEKEEKEMEEKEVMSESDKDSEGNMSGSITSDMMSSGVIGEAIEIPEGNMNELLQSGHSARSGRMARKAEREKREKEKEEKENAEEMQ